MKDPDIFREARLSMKDPSLYRDVWLESPVPAPSPGYRSRSRRLLERWRGPELILSYVSDPSFDDSRPFRSSFTSFPTWEQEFNSISELKR